MLFHAGSEATGRRQLLLGRHQRVCVLLHATPAAVPSRASDGASADGMPSGPLTAACSPDGQDGVCLAQITIPASWWPPLPPPDSAGRVKPVKVSVYIEMGIFESGLGDCGGGGLKIECSCVLCARGCKCGCSSFQRQSYLNEVRCGCGEI